MSRAVAQLTKMHGRRLAADERFISACDAFAADQPHPEPATRGRRRARSKDERLSAAGAAHLRLAAVRSSLGMIDEEFTEVPRSATGYTLAHSAKRLFLFDGTGKRYLTESETQGVWLQPIDHGDDMYTLVFKDQDQRVAFATRRESLELTLDFIRSFPDRRAQARPVIVAGQPRIADF